MTVRTTQLAYAATAAVDTWLAGHRDPRVRSWRRLTKPALMPLLALRLRASPPRVLTGPTLVALAAGGVGDVALLRQGDRAFLVGLGSFAAGHVAYVVGARRVASPEPLTAAAGPRLAVLAALGVGPVLARAAGRRSPGLGLPVAAYAALLAAAAAAASHLDRDVPAAARHLVAAGAWTFLVSDTLLGLRTFVLDEPTPALERAVMASYTLAQALLVEGAART